MIKVSLLLVALTMSNDVVATWQVALPDGVHDIEFEHGTTSGKRVIRVDGKVCYFYWIRQVLKNFLHSLNIPVKLFLYILYQTKYFNLKIWTPFSWCFLFSYIYSDFSCRSFFVILFDSHGLNLHILVIYKIMKWYPNS